MYVCLLLRLHVCLHQKCIYMVIYKERERLELEHKKHARLDKKFDLFKKSISPTKPTLTEFAVQHFLPYLCLSLHHELPIPLPLFSFRFSNSNLFVSGVRRLNVISESPTMPTDANWWRPCRVPLAVASGYCGCCCCCFCCCCHCKLLANMGTAQTQQS